MKIFQKTKRFLPLFAMLVLCGCDMPQTNKIDFVPEGEKRKFKIAQVSDLHITKKSELYSDTMKKIHESKPDMVVFTGDMIETDNKVNLLVKYIQLMDLECPKFAVPGNWEYWGNINIDVLREKLNACGVVLLINEQRTVLMDGLPVSVYGLDDYLGGTPSFANYQVDVNALQLVLGHCPVLFDSLAKKYKAVPCTFYMLSGHTHGGQITFFGLSLYVPEGSGAYVSGIYRKKNCVLNVSKGIGTSTVDMRVFSDPSIDILSF